MEYKFFDKEFLCIPESGVVGKRVFYADKFDELIEKVESGQPGRMMECMDIDPSDPYPFTIKEQDEDLNIWTEELCILAYHDPNYECKVAYSHGKIVEFRRKDNPADEWFVLFGGLFDSEHYDYRVKTVNKWYVHQDKDRHYYKDNNSTTFVEFEGTEEACDAWIKEHTSKTRRMTNREFAKWCADNKGQYFYEKSRSVFTTYSYYLSKDDELVPESIRIREWDSDAWHEPLVEVKE